MIFDDAISIIRPPSRLTISEWAEKNAWIPSEGNAEPGKYRLARMPHESAMLDDPISPGVREIFWQLASQAGGKTLSLILICEYSIAVMRRSIIMVRATKETALEWMRDKFIPTVDETPCMEGLLVEPRKRDSKSTSTNRKFPGGSLKIVGAKSPASFRGSSAPNIFQDEIDSYIAIKEGDPCALADRAAITFTDAWKIKCSTPTLDGSSKVNQGYERGDKQKFFVPCPICGFYQILSDERLKFSFRAEEHARFNALFHPSSTTWELGKFSIYDTRNAIYVCENCQRGWSDEQRIKSYLSAHSSNEPVIVNGETLRGRWQATAPFNGIRSRHLSGMYLTIGLKPGFANYHHQFAEDFLEANRGGRETLMVWTNIFKSDVYAEKGETVSWQPLKERCEDYGPKEGKTEWEVPVQVLWIVFGMDVHPDRVEIISYGWGDEQEVWTLEHKIIFGDFDMPAMQDRVADYLLNKKYIHSVLGEMGFNAGGIDSGHQTRVQAVYQFAAKYRLHNFWSVKGFDDALGAVYTKSVEKRFGGLRFNFNTDYLKTLIFDRLKKVEPGARYIHFHKSLQASFFTQLCSEKRCLERTPRGGIVWRWKKPTSSTRNEALDATVYAFGVFEVCRQEEWIARKWKEVREKLKENAQKVSEPPIVDHFIDMPQEVKLPEVDKQRMHIPRPRRRVFLNSPFRRF